MNVRNAKRSETTEQILVIQWANNHKPEYPELKWLYHCPNEGERGRSTAVTLKQMGLKAGVSDLHLPFPHGIYCGLYIEMKFDKNPQTKEQKEFLKDMEVAGHFVVTCYTARIAVEILKEYINLNENENMSIPNNVKLDEGSR